MKVTSSGLIFKTNRYSNQTGQVWIKHTATRGNYAGAGYLTVWIGGKAQYVHRLICEKFHGKPKLGQEVNHKNGIKSDNRPCNLEWVSHSENQVHMHSMNRGMLNKCNHEEVVERWKRGELQKHIASDLDVSKSLVCLIIKKYKQGKST